MSKLCSPMISRASKQARETVFKEGVSVPQKDWDALLSRNPALGSADKHEKTEATVRALKPGGELTPYRRR
jgi:hypothetical protein